jgi:DNA-directed RNA polymerase specialized sigma24 family protein
MQGFSVVLGGIPEPDSPLSALLVQYRGGQLSREDFEGRIFQFLLANYRRFHLFGQDRDAFTDYLCWLYPRLSRAIDTYKEAGSSFDAYIASIVRWSSKEYRSRAIEHRITERACWEARATEETTVDDNSPTYGEDEHFESVKNPRAILILLLKSYCFVSDDFIARVAPAIGVSPDDLTGMIDKLRELRAGHDEKIRDLQEKLNWHYYRGVAYQRQLQTLPETAVRRDKVCVLLKRAKKRYEAIKKRLETINREASNSQIAAVLGISKGAVDSSLYNIKRKAARGVYKPRE